MTEKEKEKTAEKPRHAWPPEAITCYMPTYFVLTQKIEGVEWYILVRVAGSNTEHLIRTEKYADLLEAVVQDMTIPIFKVNQQQYIEGTLGEPRWKYRSGKGEDGYGYVFGSRPEYLLKPDLEARDEYEPEPEPATPQLALVPTPATAADIYDSYCQIHHRTKQKDGHTRGSKKTPPRQKYKCPDCTARKPPVAEAAASKPEARICPVHNVPKLKNGCQLCRREGRGGSMFNPNCPHHGKKYKSGMKGSPPRQSYKCVGCQHENAKSPPPASDGRPPNCPKHGVAKVKDGHKRGGDRRWRCLTCNPRSRQPSVEPAHGKLSGLTAFYATKVKDNPPCETCGERARVARRIVRAEDGATVTYWHCTVTGCEKVHKPTIQELSGEELEGRLTAAVGSANGHDPQNRKDIVNELARRILAKEITLAQATSREIIRGVAQEINGLYQDKYGKHSPLPLDAPAPGKDGESSKQTYADRLESRGMNPEEELMAKETEEDISG